MGKECSCAYHPNLKPLASPQGQPHLRQEWDCSSGISLLQRLRFNSPAN